MSLVSRAARRVWRARAMWAVGARAALLPAGMLYRLAGWARNATYDAGWRAAVRLPRPSVGIGNLAVGGTGKTPLAAWVARWLASAGLVPGILLRGYGGDETRELAAALPEAVIEDGADRVAAAQRAVSRGAEVLVLDDCLQHRRVAPDVLLAVLAAETWAGPRWPLPAGPWREGAGALARADAVVVTRKTASAEQAERLAEALARRTRSGLAVAAHLLAETFRPLARGGRGRGGGDGAALGPEALRGRSVVALCGIGEPELFAAQLAALGAEVRLVDVGDHHAYTRSDVDEAVRLAGVEGVVVTTAKDAVKLAGLWPAAGPACLVAELRVRIGAGAAGLAALLERVATAARAVTTGAAAAPLVRKK